MVSSFSASLLEKFTEIYSWGATAGALRSEEIVLFVGDVYQKAQVTLSALLPPEPCAPATLQPPRAVLWFQGLFLTFVCSRASLPSLFSGTENSSQNQDRDTHKYLHSVSSLLYKENWGRRHWDAFSAGERAWLRWRERCFALQWLVICCSMSIGYWK